MISVRFQGKLFNIAVIQAYAPTSNAEEPELRPTRPSRTNTQEGCPFHYRGLEYKLESQEIPGTTGKFGLGVQNETGQRPIEFYQENALLTANSFFQQHN